MPARALTNGQALFAVGAAALAGASALLPASVAAQQEVADARPPQHVLEKQLRQFTRQECSLILMTTAEVIKIIGHHGYNPELPVTLAKWIAPTNHTFALSILVNGGFSPEQRTFFTSTNPADIERANAIRASITCNGDRA